MEELNIFSAEQATEILKAVEAGSGTGRDYTDTLNTGASLKVESLEPVVKSLLQKKDAYVLFNKIPKETVYNNVNEFNLQTSYGENLGIFVGEGETPEFTDPLYKRKARRVAYMGLSGQVTHQSQLVKTSDGKNSLARTQESIVMKLMEIISKDLATSDSSKSATSFDGIFKQHFDGIVEINGMEAGSSAQKLDAYFSDIAVIDLRGKALTEESIQDGLNAIVNERFGDANSILANPTIFKNFANRFQGYKQIFVNGTDSTGNVNTTVGQSVGRIQTQNGSIGTMQDRFFDKFAFTAYNVSATTPKAPAIPVVGGTPVAVATDTSTKFTDGAGDYFYGVRAKNRYGLSAMLALNTVAQAVTTAQSVDLSFTAGSGVYAAESYIIYRTEVDVVDYTKAKYYPIFEISVAELTAGYDGAAAGKVRDRNRFVSGCQSAIVYDNADSDVLKYIQLLPMMRMDYALTQPSRRFSVLNYATPQMSTPGKVVRIVNVGADLS